MTRKKLRIGLFGFGVVGQGLYEVLEKTPALHAQIVKICVKDRIKERTIAASHFTFHQHELLYNDVINVIVELIDDAEAAYHIVKTAMENGKAVVSANKKMIAEHLDELIALQQKYQVPFLYEAAVCAGIPVIRNLEEYYDNELIHSISGIVNGSTNYILTKMSETGTDYQEALREAQAAGYAESDPWLDVSGRDAVNKLSILVAHAWGRWIHPDAIVSKGIDELATSDFEIASVHDLKIRLKTFASRKDNRLITYVLPAFTSSNDPAYRVNGVFNGVEIESSFADKHYFSGKGAGAYPTASAVLSDISAISYDYKYEYKKRESGQKLNLDLVFSVNVYFRFTGNVHKVKTYFDEVKALVEREGEYILIGSIPLSKIPYLNGPVIAVPDEILDELAASLNLSETLMPAEV
ncbi:MAG: homoserine dehydrogenase [Flavobacteriales bacterium]|nr:homoserine dehydrogenase [Flavobacteriales bacterium]